MNGDHFDNAVVCMQNISKMQRKTFAIVMQTNPKMESLYQEWGKLNERQTAKINSKILLNKVHKLIEKFLK